MANINILPIKELADKMMQSTTRVLGGVLETHGKYIVYKEGAEGLKQVEQKMTELGHPLSFKDIKNFDYYPIGIVSLPVVIAKKIFHWQDKDIFEMGSFAPKYSAVIKLILKYFVSVEKLAHESSKAWTKHNTTGDLVCDFNEAKKQIILKLTFDPLDPLFCLFFQGYFLTVFKLVIRGKNINIQETRCAFNGAPYHEFLISWT